MKLLRIDSSISGDSSVSRQLTTDISDQLAPESAIVHRDLVAAPLAHLTERGQDPDILAEFMAAD